MKKLTSVLLALLLVLCALPVLAEGGYTVSDVSKYGNITLDVENADFLALGYEYGDVVTVTLPNGTALALPFVSNYSDVDSGSPALLARAKDTNVVAAINMGNFAQTYAVAVGDTLAVAMAEKQGYIEQYYIHQLSRTDVREDYAALSDEAYANVRMVMGGNIKEGRLYRGSSPVNNEINRAAQANAAIETAGVKAVMNLADDNATIEGYFAQEGFGSEYYKALYEGGNVIALNLGVDLTGETYRQGLAKGLSFLATKEGPWYLHCNEGKDRAGFASAIVEALCGATLDEIVADYMVTYYNYYGLDAATEPEKYAAVANSNIRASLAQVFNVEKDNLATCDLAAAAETYLLESGMTAEAITAVRDALTK